MKNRKLGDAMYFFEEMKRRGMPLDVSGAAVLCRFFGEATCILTTHRTSTVYPSPTLHLSAPRFHCVQSTSYGIAISAAGRCGQPARALELRDEMLAQGLEVTHNIRLALLHTFAGGCAGLLGGMRGDGGGRWELPCKLHRSAMNLPGCLL